MGGSTRVPVYHWALPEDLEPLCSAVRSIIAGNRDVALFLTAVQVVHLVEVAEQMGETSKMGVLIHEAAARANDLLNAKRNHG